MLSNTGIVIMHTAAGRFYAFTKIIKLYYINYYILCITSAIASSL